MVLLATTVLAPMSRAADVEFDPTLSVNAFYDGNTRGVGETDDPNQDDPSAIVGGVGLNLPWSVRTPSRAFAFAYRIRREIYGDDERPDFTSHALNASLSRTVSPRASYAVTASYDRSDRQQLDPRRPPEELVDARTYTFRRTFESGGLGASGSFSSGRRSTLSWRLGARLERGEDLADSPFEDSESYNGAFGWSLAYSQQGSAGVGVVVQHFAYENAPGVDVVSIGHTGSRQLSRDGTLNYAVGALRSDNDGVTNVAGSLNLGATWTLGARSSLAAGVRQGASAGDGTSGATLDRGGYVSWSFATPRGFNASVAATYWDRRNLDDPSQSSTLPAAFTVSDTFSWRLGRFFRLGVFHSYQNQGSNDPALETSYHSAGLNGTWILRGDRRAGA